MGLVTSIFRCKCGYSITYFTDRKKKIVAMCPNCQIELKLLEKEKGDETLCAL